MFNELLHLGDVREPGAALQAGARYQLVQLRAHLGRVHQVESSLVSRHGPHLSSIVILLVIFSNIFFLI